MFKSATTAAFAAILFSSITALAGATPEQKCEGGMNQEAGKYAACIAKAEKGFVSTADGTKYGRSCLSSGGKVQWSSTGA